MFTRFVRFTFACTMHIKWTINTNSHRNFPPKNWWRFFDYNICSNKTTDNLLCLNSLCQLVNRVWYLQVLHKVTNYKVLWIWSYFATASFQSKYSTVQIFFFFNKCTFLFTKDKKSQYRNQIAIRSKDRSNNETIRKHDPPCCVNVLCVALMNSHYRNFYPFSGTI